MKSNLINKERGLNLIWTVSEDYGFFPKKNFFEEKLRKRGDFFLTYSYILTGGVRQYLDYDKLEDFKYSLITQIKDPSVFLEILFLSLEEYVYDRLVTQRKGIVYIRRQTIDAILRSYFYYPPQNLNEELQQAYYSKKKGKVAAVNTPINNLLSRIQTITKIAVDTEGIIDFLIQLFDEHFHFEFSFENKIENKKRNITKKDREKTPKGSLTEKNFFYDRTMDQLSDEYTSAEFSSNVVAMDLEDLKEKEKPATQITAGQESVFSQKVVSLFGKSILSTEETHRMEALLSIGIHHGQQIHMTKGIFSEDNKDDFRITQIADQRRENLRFFDEKSISYRRNIMRLKNNLLRTLSKYQDYSQEVSKSGRLNSAKVWRMIKVKDENVFLKEKKGNGSTFVVDILLDASGSQQERCPDVAIQGYILSQALSLCNIAHRVSSFNNFMNHSIIRIFRDYDDSIIKNKEIFNFYATGSNRDGMAIQIIREDLIKRTEENKILIVLSDGKPYDIRISKKFNPYLQSADYEGKSAIDDTSMEIRKTRKMGIAVLGVFTGNDEELEAVKLIYGKDFAYIHHIERFSETVGFYLKRQMESILEYD